MYPPSVFSLLSYFYFFHTLASPLSGSPLPFGHPSTTPSAIPSSSKLGLPPLILSKNLTTNANAPVRIQVPLPSDPRRHITVYLYLAADVLAVAQIEYCLVALNTVVTNVMRSHGDRVIPTDWYPWMISPTQAMGAYVEIEAGEDGGLRLETLRLAVRGLFGALVQRGRRVECTFEIE